MKKINKNTILDCGESIDTIVNDRWNSQEPAISFKDLFGDLSDFIYEGCLELGNLNLNSLEGYPKVSGGYFSIENNPELKELNFMPGFLANVVTLYIDYSQVDIIKNIDIDIYKNLIIRLCGVPISNRDMVLAFSDFRKFNKGFGNIQTFTSKGVTPGPIDYANLEKLYKVYEKVNYDREKFDRAIALL